MDPKKTPGFVITLNKGFQMTFENGWTVSVQWGYGNYCSNKSYSIMERTGDPVPKAGTAEIAAWDKNGERFRFASDSVKGWCTPAEVVKFMAKIARKK